MEKWKIRPSSSSADSNSFLSPHESLPIVQDNIFFCFLSLSLNGMLLVLLLEWPHRGDSNEYIQTVIVE